MLLYEDFLYIPIFLQQRITGILLQENLYMKMFGKYGIYVLQKNDGTNIIPLFLNQVNSAFVGQVMPEKQMLVFK